MQSVRVGAADNPHRPVNSGVLAPADAARLRARWLTRLCRSWSAAGALVMLCLSVYLPGLTAIPPVDRDESRFAQASRHMAESGDLVVPRIQDRPRLNKPPLIYWLQSASIGILGDAPGRFANANIWVFRLPSVLCAMGAVVLTWRLGLRMFDPRAAVLGAAMLAVCPMVVWDAHQARADQLLLLCTVAAQFALFVVWDRDVRGRPTLGPAAMFWLAVALGILAKGPVAPLIATLTIVWLSVFHRRARWVLALYPAVGLAILAVIVAPWVAMVVGRVGWSEYLRVVVDETVGRSTSPKENHWYPPGFHLILFTLLFWPGSLLTGLAVARAWRRARATRCRPPARPRPVPESFLLAWVIPSWIFFEIISTKLPHYTMPLYPALALLSARAVFAGETGRLLGTRGLGARAGFAIWLLVGIGATFGVSIAIAAIGRLSPDESIAHALRPLALPGAVMIVGFIAAARAIQHGAFLRAQVWSLVVIVLWGATFLQFIFPSASRLWITPRIVAALPAEATLAANGFVEDSLIFTTRARAARISDDQLSRGEFGRAEWVLHPVSAQLPASVERLLDGVSHRIVGLNYSNGKAVNVVLRRVNKPSE